MKKFTLLTALLISALFALPARAADLSITASSFQLGENAKTEIGTAGAVLTVGQLIYLDSTAQTWKLADANLSAAAASVAAIVASPAAAIGNKFVYCYRDDDLTPGATLSMTAPVYCLSGTAGGICPVADLTTGFYPAVVFVAKSTTKCVFNPQVLRGGAVLSALFDPGAFARFALVPPPVAFKPVAFNRPRPAALPSARWRWLSYHEALLHGFASSAA